MKKTFATIAITLCALTAGAQGQLTHSVSEVEPLKEWAVDLVLDTELTDYAAMQFSIDYPSAFAITGYTMGTALNNHSIVTSADYGTEPHEGVVIYSLAGDTFAPDGSPILTFGIRTADGERAAQGQHTIQMSDIRIARYDGTEDIYPNISINLNCGVTDAVTAVDTHVERADIYNVSGRLVRRGASVRDLPAGLYIVNGRKVLVK